MKVLVLSTMVPFVHSGSDELRDHLVRNLCAAGVEAEAMCLPFSWHPSERLIDEMLIARGLRISRVDRLIALKFPAYLVEHPNKVIWLLHHHGQAYDLVDTEMFNRPSNPDEYVIRSAIRNADWNALSGATRLFANSPVTAERLRRYHKLDPMVLAPALNDPELFTGGESRNYILVPDRITPGNRQELLLRALRYAPGVRLVIAGPPDSEQDTCSLKALAKVEGVIDRVTFHLRRLSRKDLADLVNGATAVANLPVDADWMGYVTMEAFQAAKPVLTANDAGGVLEVVHHGATGVVAPPSAESLGTAMMKLHNDPPLAVAMGHAARAELASRHLTWPAIIERLLS